jgi:hypothetical protein
LCRTQVTSSSPHVDEVEYSASIRALSLSLPPPFQNGLELANIFSGKTHQHGRIEYRVALRPPGASWLSNLMFSYLASASWETLKVVVPAGEGISPVSLTQSRHTSFDAGSVLESSPQFRTSADWCKIKVLKRDDEHLTDPLSVHTASNWTSRIQHCGIQSSKCCALRCQPSMASQTRAYGASQTGRH